MGFAAGSNLTTGNNDIDIGNRGVAGEANTIRIGTAGTQTAAYIAGIAGVTVTGNPVVIDESGQLGTADIRPLQGPAGPQGPQGDPGQLAHKVQQDETGSHGPSRSEKVGQGRQVQLVPLAQRAHKAQQVQLAPLAQLVRKALLVQLVRQEQQVHKARQELG